MTMSAAKQARRATAAYAEVVRQLRMLGCGHASDLVYATMHALDISERRCGGDIIDAMVRLIAEERADCNTRNRADGSIVFDNTTVIWPLPAIGGSFWTLPRASL